MPKTSPYYFEAWRAFPLGLKNYRLTLNYQSEGRILLPWVLWKPVFKKLQVKVRELWKRVLKREKRKYVEYTKSRITGFCQLELFTTLNSMALTQLKFFLRRSLVSSRTNILVFSKLLLVFPFLSNMFSILISLCKFFHTRNMQK